MRVIAGNLYASYVAHMVRWSPGVQALLSAMLMNGSGSFAAIVVTQVLRPRILRMSKRFNADADVAGQE
jgi:hypothetical protein